jgi:hypothetical protein
MGDLKREDEDAQLFRAVVRVARVLGMPVEVALGRLRVLSSIE